MKVDLTREEAKMLLAYSAFQASEVHTLGEKHKAGRWRAIWDKCATVYRSTES